MHTRHVLVKHYIVFICMMKIAYVQCCKSASRQMLRACLRSLGCKMTLCVDGVKLRMEGYHY